MQVIRSRVLVRVRPVLSVEDPSAHQLEATVGLGGQVPTRASWAGTESTCRTGRGREAPALTMCRSPQRRRPVGDIDELECAVRTDLKFGAGYEHAVLIEAATPE